MPRRACRLVLLACTLTVLTPGAAPAAQWSAPTQLTPTVIDKADGSYMDLLTAVGDDGTLAAAWLARDGASSSIFAATRPPGGAWGAPARVSADGEWVNRTNREMAVAADRDGAVTVVWASGNDVKAATRQAGEAAFGDPVVVAAASDVTDLPAVVADRDGRLVAAWIVRNEWTVATATRSPGAGGAWSSPVTIETGTGNVPPALATAPDGATTVLYASSSGTALSSRRLASGSGSWSGAETVESSGPSISQPYLAAGPDGTVAAAWDRDDTAGDGPDTVRAAVRPAGPGTWASPAALNPPGTFGFIPQVAVGPGGTVTVLWTDYNNPDAGAYMSVTGAVHGDDGWAPMGLVSPHGQVSGFGVPFVAPGGRLTALWFATTDMSYFFVQSTTADGPGGPLSAPEDRATNVFQQSMPAAASNVHGAIGLAWVVDTGTGTTVYASDLAGDDTVPGPPAPGDDPSAAPQDDPAPAPGPAPKPPATLAPKPAELTLRGRTITVRATVRMRGKTACRGRATATAGTGSRRATARLTLRPVLQAGVRTCVAGGTIRLRAAPSATITVRITGPKTVSRTLTVRR